MRDFLIFAEQGFVVFSLTIFTGAWTFILYEIRTGQSSVDATQGVLAIQAFFYAIYALTFLLIVLRWKKFIHALIKGDPLLILVGLALLSVLWSDAPTVTLRRSLALVGTTLFGMYLATRYSLQEQLQLLAWTLGLSALSSLLFTLALPAYGIMYSDAIKNAWRGIYIQKNILGLMMVLSTLVFLLLAPSSRKYRNLLWAVISLSVCLVLLSSSKNALVLLLILLILLPLYRVLRWNFSWMLLFFIAVIIVFGSLATLIFSNWEAVLSSLGRDATFTGRTGIWDAVLKMIQERPWFGYGYSGFWLGRDGKSAYVLLATGWNPGYAHNGFLDLCLDLGLLGVLIYLLSFLISSFRAVTWLRLSKTADGFWPLICLSIALISNFSEGTILKQNNIFWVLYVAVTLSTSIGYTTSSSRETLPLKEFKTLDS